MHRIDITRLSGFLEVMQNGIHIGWADPAFLMGARKQIPSLLTLCLLSHNTFKWGVTQSVQLFSLLIKQSHPYSFALLSLFNLMVIIYSSSYFEKTTMFKANFYWLPLSVGTSRHLWIFIVMHFYLSAAFFSFVLCDSYVCVRLFYLFFTWVHILAK